MASYKAKVQPKSSKGQPKGKGKSSQLKPAIAFEIDLSSGEVERPRSAAPRRLRQQHDRPAVSLDEVEDKQRKAEDRRKALEEAKLKRMQDHTETRKNVSQNVHERAMEDDGGMRNTTSHNENDILPALRAKLGDSVPKTVQNRATSNTKDKKSATAGRSTAGNTASSKPSGAMVARKSNTAPSRKSPKTQPKKNARNVTSPP